MHHRRLALLGTVGVIMTLIAGCGSVGGGGGGSSTRAAGASQDPKDMTMVNVVKIKGISWFDRMAVGDENFAKRRGSTPARKARTTPARRSRSRSSKI